MNEEEMCDFIRLLKKHVSLGGHDTTFTEVGYDDYGVFHLHLENGRSDETLWISKNAKGQEEASIKDILQELVALLTDDELMIEDASDGWFTRRDNVVRRAKMLLEQEKQRDNT